MVVLDGAVGRPLSWQFQTVHCSLVFLKKSIEGVNNFETGFAFGDYEENGFPVSGFLVHKFHFFNVRLGRICPEIGCFRV